MIILGMTPHFHIRVWGSVGPFKGRETMADIEVNTVDYDGELTIGPHRGLDIILQKMLIVGTI